MKRIIDKDGMFLRDDTQWNENEVALDIEPNNDLGLYQPKWNGEEWVEGATEEYIDSLKQPIEEVATLNLEEKVLEHEEKIVTLEETLDVLFGGAE